MAVWPVIIAENVVLYCQFRRESKGFDSIFLIALNMARCQIRYDHKEFNSVTLIKWFKSQLFFRCKIDFVRLPKHLFCQIWCRNEVIAKVNDNGLIVCLK